MEISTLHNKKNEIEYYFINLIILLFIFRGSMPWIKYPFIVLFVCLVIYIFTKIDRSRLKTGIVIFSRNFTLVIILFCFFIFAFLFSNKIYLIVFKEFINTLVLLSFFFILFIKILDKKDLDLYLKTFIKLNIIFSILISLVLILDLLNVSQTGDYIRQPLYHIETGDIPVDYNFALLPVFFGILSAIYISLKELKNSSIFWNLTLTLNSICIFFSGSRRGIFLLILIFATLFIINILSLFTKRSLIKKICISTKYYIVLFSLFLISGYYITFHTSFEFKNAVLRFFGTKDLVASRGEIAFSLSRYHSVLNPTKSYYDTYDLIWTPVFNPLDPDSGWGSKTHKTVFPLTGKNVEIIPRNAKGYYLDHTTNCDTADNQAFSATFLSTFDVSHDRVLSASVFCYISEDCDISTAMICSLGSMGNPGSSYDLSRKGIWQKLSFNIDCKDGTASVLLFISKHGLPNFSALKGHIIFAYPQFVVEDKSKFVGLEETSLDNDFRNDDIFSRREGYAGGHNETNLSGILQFGNFFSPLLKSVDPDFIRNLTSQMISEDTTYLSPKDEFSKLKTGNNVIHGRLDRWKFAIFIFSNEYSLFQKMFGGGFCFLNWYGYYFYSDKTKSDWPHNPFLSTILYSGLLGFIFYMYAIFKVFILYIKFSRYIPVIFAFFLIAFFFSFFSASSPFDPPVFGFFFMLPFLINNIVTANQLSKRQ